jgi:hypothetical protein
VLLLLLGSLYGILHLPTVQTWIVKKATNSLSKQLHTKVTIDRVDFSFFYKLEFQNLLIEDHQKDTLLFAGAAQVDLNDWFFAKDKIILKYIGLESTVINIKRRNEEWNYQFLSDYFGKSSGNKKSSQINLDLQTLQLKNIKFNYIDGWVGSDMIAELDEMTVDFNKADLNNLNLNISNISLTKPVFIQKDYDGYRPANYIKPHPLKSNINSTQKGIEILISKIKIKDGLYQNNKQTKRLPLHDQFDAFHFQFNSITGEINNFSLKNDNIEGDLKLSGKEINGLIVKNISSQIKFTPKIMEFNNLDLKINNSQIGDYYAMHYESFNDDMIDFISKVKIEGKFKNSKVSSDDISIFAPELKDWKKIFQVNGEMIGTIDNFKCDNIDIKTEQSTIKGNLIMKGIPDINSTFIVFKSDGSQTNLKELSSIIPSLKEIKNNYFNKLNNIYFKGLYEGSLSNFKIDGNINSSIGNLNGSFNLNIADHKNAFYSGKIINGNLDIGKLTDVPSLGNLSLSGNFNGKSFDPEKIKINYDFDINQFSANKYTYKNIKLNGDYIEGKLSNIININDNNFRTNKLMVNLNFKENIKTQITGDVDYLNFKSINISDSNLTFSGNINSEFNGLEINNIDGFIKLNDIKFKNNQDLLSLRYLNLTSEISNQKRRRLSLKSNEAEAYIDGEFKLNEIPDAFSSILHKYYPAYVPLGSKLSSQQNFNYEIKTKNIEDYLSLFDQHIKGFNNSYIKGAINLYDKSIKLDAKVPELSYQGKVFTKINLQFEGNKDSLITNASISDIIFSDSVHFPETKINLSSTEDNTEIHIKTSASTTLNNADFNARVQTFNDGLNIHFYPSSFIINDKKWFLEKDGELSIRKNFVNANEIKFNHRNEQIILSSELDELTNESHLNAQFKDIAIEDFVPYLFTDPDVKGKLSGTIKITDPLGKATASFNGKIDSLLLENKVIGNIEAIAKVNTNNGIINFNAYNKDTTNLFNIDGAFNYKDTLNNQIDLSLEGKKINLSILEPYLNGVFSQIEGTGTSHLIIKGNNQHKSLTGFVKVNNASLKVGYTQCRYFIENQNIKFEDGFINLDMLQIKDSLNNTATVKGNIKHDFFDQINFDNINVESGKISLLNTTKYDNNQFYGSITGKAFLKINGPLENLKMDIDGEPSILDSSHIYLNTSDTKENSSIDYIDFIPFGTKMEDIKNKIKNNIVVNLNIKANPSCKVDVILDEETGDIIKGQGNGLINIKVGNIEPLSIRGSYNITKGDYTFNFQTFLKKPFTLSKGIITWNGDPYSASIDIDAEYLAKNVDISSLSPNISISKKEDLKIISHINGYLLHPNVKFDLQLQDKSETKRDDIAVKRLAEFKNDDNEMNKQVASLLLFNAIIVNNQNFLSQGNASSMITNTVGGIISSLLTNLFNKELEKATKGILSTYIDINPTFDLKKSTTQLQANIRAGLKILLSNRLNVLVGGNLDYNNPIYLQQLEKKGLITPDIIVEWLINKDGSLRIIGFNRSSIDLTMNQRNRSGLQLSYRKDVNKLSDILKSKKKIDVEEKIINSPALKPKED